VADTNSDLCRLLISRVAAPTASDYNHDLWVVVYDLTPPPDQQDELYVDCLAQTVGKRCFSPPHAGPPQIDEALQIGDSTSEDESRIPFVPTDRNLPPTVDALEIGDLAEWAAGWSESFRESAYAEPQRPVGLTKRLLSAMLAADGGHLATSPLTRVIEFQSDAENEP
jgi:hypothetical protein